MPETIFGYTPTTDIAVDKSAEARLKQETMKQEKQPFDFLGVMRAGAQVTGQFAAEKNQADAHTAYMESWQFMASIDHMDGHEKVAAIEGKIKEQSGDNFSSGYRQGSLSVLDKAYASALLQKEEERVATGLNVGATTWIANLAGGYQDFDSAEGFIDQYGTKNNLNKAQVRDAIYTGVYEHYSLQSLNAKSDDELTAINEEFNQVVQRDFKGTFFEGSKAKKFNAVVKEAKANHSSTVAAKRKHFTELEQTKIEIGKGDGQSSGTSYTLKPEDFRWDIAYRDKDQRVKQFIAYQNNYNQAQEARAFMGSYNPMNPHPSIESVVYKDNKFIQKEWPQYVANVGMQKLLLGNTESFTDVMTGEGQKSADELGTQINQSYMNARTTEEIRPLLNRLEDTFNTNGGATILNNSIGEQQLARMMATITLADVHYEGDLSKARDFVAQQDRSLTKMTWDKSTFATVQDRTVALGVHGNRYKATMDTLNQINPAMATEMEEKVAEHFKNLQEETHDVMWDTSVANYFDTNNVAQPDVLKQNIIDSFVMTTNSQPTRIQTLHNGGFIAFDDVTGLSHVLSMDWVMKEHDRAVMEQADFTGEIPVSEEIYSVATDITMGLKDSIGRIGGRFGEYLKTQTEEDWNKLKKIFTTDIDISKVRPEDRPAVEQAIEKNKIINNRIDKMRELSQREE